MGIYHDPVLAAIGRFPTARLWVSSCDVVEKSLTKDGAGELPDVSPTSPQVSASFNYKQEKKKLKTFLEFCCIASCSLILLLLHLNQQQFPLLQKVDTHSAVKFLIINSYLFASWRGLNHHSIDISELPLNGSHFLQNLV